MAPKIDVNFLNPFIECTVEALKAQCSLSVKPDKPFLKGQQSLTLPDIAAIIAVTSEQFNGSISICFTQAVFLTIMNKMLGAKHEAITHELEDGAAELLNIIFARAKKTLSEKNYTIERAMPSILKGSELEAKQYDSRPTLVLPFSTEIGAFHIQVVTQAA